VDRTPGQVIASRRTKRRARAERTGPGLSNAGNAGGRRATWPSDDWDSDPRSTGGGIGPRLRAWTRCRISAPGRKSERTYSPNVQVAHNQFAFVRDRPPSFTFRSESGSTDTGPAKGSRRDRTADGPIPDPASPAQSGLSSRMRRRIVARVRWRNGRLWSDGPGGRPDGAAVSRRTSRAEGRGLPARPAGEAPKALPSSSNLSVR
jgi:hypothetical protein